MTRLGFNHIDLATNNMAETRDFYERILGFPVVRSDMVELETGGYVEHVFFDCGGGQMIAFAGAEHAPGRFPANLDTSINKGLGLSRGVYHFAFEAGSQENLTRLKAELERNGVAVTRRVDDRQHAGGIGDDVLERAGGKPCVERKRDRADAHRSEEEFDELGAVPHQHGHALARTHAERSGAKLAPPTDLVTLASLLRGAILCVSNNSGPMHLAVAVGTPTVGLFLSDDRRRWAHDLPWFETAEPRRDDDAASGADALQPRRYGVDDCLQPGWPHPGHR